MKRLLLVIISFLLWSTLQAKVEVEDFLQYAPTVANFTLRPCGVPSAHTFEDRIFVSAASWAIMFGTTAGLKYAVSETRPDGSDDHSFPSGHAARAFCGANILAHEYWKVSPWIGVAGYATATATAVLRVTGRHHYTHDVLAGAAIGVLSSEAGYLLLPVWQKIRHRKAKAQKSSDVAFVVLPGMGTEQAGVSGTILF